MSKDGQDEHGDVNLDSDEMDSDDALDEDLKNHSDAILDEPLSDELGLPERQPTAATTDSDIKTQKLLKRKITYNNGSTTETSEESKGSKKIVLKRPSLPPTTLVEPKTEEENAKTASNRTEKVKITADLDTKTRLELRAKKFGLPIKMTDDQKKEARKQRFGQNNSSAISTDLSSDFDKLKKRAERFGQSVSKLMTDIENKEKLEKRKAKFSADKK